ncbi:hypothetical protein [Proteus cibi]|uniref:hypothetical protein n=1 Tax=Proteus cibi TaxID=2050966 RepID=UPI0035A60AE6
MSFHAVDWATVINWVTVIGGLSSTCAVFVAVGFYLRDTCKAKKKLKIENKNEIQAIKNIASNEAYILLQHIEFIFELHFNSSKAKSIDIELIDLMNYRGIFFVGKSGEKIEGKYLPPIPTEFSHEFMLHAARKSIRLSSALLNINLQIMTIRDFYTSIFKYIAEHRINDVVYNSAGFFEKRDGVNSLASMMKDASLPFSKEMRIAYKGYDDTIHYINQILK